MTFPFINMSDYILPLLGAVDIITVTDYAAGSHDPATGRWVQGAGTDTLTEAVVQPATMKDTQQLPVNERTKETIAIYTRTPLFTSDVTTAEESNKVTWQGRDYKVLSIDNWSAQAEYAKHIAVRIGV